MASESENFKYEFRVGDYVWAKMKGYPPWPGRIIEHGPEIKLAKTKGKQLVHFFGTENYAMIPEEVIWPFEEFKEKYDNPTKKPKGFLDGLEMIKEEMKLQPQVDAIPRRARTPSPPRSTASSTDRRSSKSGSGRKSLTKTESSTPRSVSRAAPKRVSEGSSFVRPPSAKTSRLLGDKSFTKMSDRVSAMLDFGSTPAEEGGDSFGGRLHSSMIGDSQSSYMPDILPMSPTEHLVAKKIMPTPLKIGFIGLGIMGSGLAENLLKSGHEVTVWNRNQAKCRDLVAEGALRGSDPADVVTSCDIIFTCVSDGAALRDLFFKGDGILSSLGHGKGFVDLSTVDVECIQDVNEAVTSRGGRFLEAPVIGTKESAHSGQVLILASGDKSLYEDCYSCFQAMGRHMMFLGTIASATRMKLVVSLLLGTTLAGLAESLALSEKLGLSSEDVLRVFSYTNAASMFLKEKGSDMIHNRLDPSCKLLTLAKDLRLSVNMSDTVDQPLHVGAATCELFKKAKAKGYGEHDVAAVFRAADL